MYTFISANEAFYDEDSMLFNCYVGINDANKSVQYTAHGKTELEAIDRAASLAYLLNKIEANLSRLREGN